MVHIELCVIHLWFYSLIRGYLWEDGLDTKLSLQKFYMHYDTQIENVYSVLLFLFDSCCFKFLR